jgi:hypothetical protein
MKLSSNRENASFGTSAEAKENPEYCIYFFGTSIKWIPDTLAQAGLSNVKYRRRTESAQVIFQPS